MFNKIKEIQENIVKIKLIKILNNQEGNHLFKHKKHLKIIFDFFIYIFQSILLLYIFIFFFMRIYFHL